MDLKRFICEIGDELQCQICTLVLVNPAQTPCEHYFCNACINHWLSINAVCPLDRQPLSAVDLRPPSRLLRNLLSKLAIRCNFYEDGCPEILMLDNLQKHLTACVYNPDAKVTCDKGCSMVISLSEHKADDCFDHLESKVRCQQDQISLLIEKVRIVKELAEIEKNGLREEISKLNDNVTQQRQEITKLNALMNGIIHFSSIYAPNWQTCKNIKFEMDDESILQREDQSKCGLVQSAHHLDAAFRFFEISIPKRGGTFTMGLTSRGLAHHIRQRHSFNCFSYRSSGEVTFGYKCKKTEKMWREGDVIRCGMRPPSIIEKCGEIYFAKNGKEIASLFFDNPFNIKLYPTVYIEGSQHAGTPNMIAES